MQVVSAQGVLGLCVFASAVPLARADDEPAAAARAVDGAPPSIPVGPPATAASVFDAWNNPAKDKAPAWVDRYALTHLRTFDAGLFIAPSEVFMAIPLTKNPWGADGLPGAELGSKFGFGAGLRFGYWFGRVGLQVGVRSATYGSAPKLDPANTGGNVKVQPYWGSCADVGVVANVLSLGRLTPIVGLHGGMTWWNQIPSQTRADGATGASSGALTPMVAATLGLRWALTGAGGGSPKPADVERVIVPVITAGVRAEVIFPDDISGQGRIFLAPVVVAEPYLSFSLSYAGG